MINIEIDGKQVTVPKGSTVMEAAKQVGIYIPHFCYHKKLSIAANCRMCLVEVEKAPKPLPACATPAADGMKVSTQSQQAVTAQKGVMEFLLINHPLDCPICDQGGECQLQDLAVGYGSSGSRYQEAKRVVTNKNLGPLISTDMTRCIHCTRCVRFGQEIAGIMELGMAGRGEHSEILSFVGKTVDSELSGNVIDLCPVGALVSKPFRYSARTWELSRRKSISPHCGLGSNLVVQVKQDRVMRVLPRDNESINECWLSDKDRFAYEGLNSDDRLRTPLIKRDGQWQACNWQEALAFAVDGVQKVIQKHGQQAIGALGSPHSTLEELYLLQKLVRGLGSQNIDHRIRQSDFRADTVMPGIPWLGTPIANVSELKAMLVIGSTLRKDHPLLAQRMRQAVKQGGQLSLINPVNDDLLTKVAHRAIVAPSAMAGVLAQVLKAAADIKGARIPSNVQAAVESVDVSETARAMAGSLIEQTPAAIFLGNLAQHHPQYADLLALAEALSTITGASFGVLGEAANSVGAFVAGAVPWMNTTQTAADSESSPTGMNAGQMLGWAASSQEGCRGYILMNLEPELDSYDTQRAIQALSKADFVVSLSSYQGNVPNYAHVILPIAPFTETSGTFVNTEGRLQGFNGVVPPLGETRPAWKVLRVLGNLLQLDGFDYETSEQVRAEIVPDGQQLSQLLNNSLATYAVSILHPVKSIERIGEVPIYQADPIVRRAASLQATRDAALPVAFISTGLLDKLGLQAGEAVRIKQGEQAIQVTTTRDDSLPDNCVRLACAYPQTAMLGAMFGEIELEKL
ncbi:NADH-quinone oxidoreductase subunit NuoG [Nitrosomonas halophila]|uniref:NADH-quinone oxidoreductase n=1 Tax=Nitrosomonas halophila TaxID=44576 RepID=A0A1H3CI85_9PROT|nr:NADH-quinone oxidoreductase subunit NuoG [Nitrosomonas halophila]SDX53294.1 NADH-quinone oxidoreductase subunit G [Nitrosomonas halophila]